MDGPVGREPSDDRWDSYQKYCNKVVIKLSGCCIVKNRSRLFHSRQHAKSFFNEPDAMLFQLIQDGGVNLLVYGNMNPF